MTNEKYIGELKQGKTYVINYLDKKTKKNKGEREFVIIENHHEPIIEKEIFYKVQEELEKRNKETQKNTPSKFSGKYAFSSKIVCNQCQGTYAVGPTKTLKSGAIRRSYRCGTRITNGKRIVSEQGEIHGCSSDIVYEDVLKEILKEIIQEIAEDKARITNDIQKAVESIINKRERKEGQENTILKKKKELETERQRAIELCIKGLITEQELEEKRKDKEQELQRINEELKQQQEEIKALDNKDEIIKKSKQIVSDIVNTKIITDEICRTLVDKVIVYSKNELEFYLKGNSGDFFKREGVILYNNHVAMLYHYETKNVNKAVKRNIDRFPEDFCFQLTKSEMDKMWFQNGTTSKGENNKYRSEKYLPYAYTEQGIAMLSGVLKNSIAVDVSINIMRAFIEMRKFINTNKNLFEKVINIENKMDKKFIEQDKKFDIIFDQLQLEENIKQRIFFDGQIYDAYSLIIDIIKNAKNKILMIDNYIDDSILKMLSKKNKDVEVVILTSQNSKISKLDITKFNKQYPTLKIAYTNKFHDRFIVIDNKELYHCGASLKDVGKKCFAINKMEDMNFIKNIENPSNLC